MRRLFGILLAGAMMILPAFSQSAFAQPGRRRRRLLWRLGAGGASQRRQGRGLRGGDREAERLAGEVGAARSQAATGRLEGDEESANATRRQRALLHVINPLVTDADYSVTNLVYEVVKDPTAQKASTTISGCLEAGAVRDSGPDDRRLREVDRSHLAQSDSHGLALCEDSVPSVAFFVWGGRLMRGVRGCGWSSARVDGVDIGRCSTAPPPPCPTSPRSLGPLLRYPGSHRPPAAPPTGQPAGTRRRRCRNRARSRLPSACSSTPFVPIASMTSRRRWAIRQAALASSTDERVRAAGSGMAGLQGCRGRPEQRGAVCVRARSNGVRRGLQSRSKPGGRVPGPSEAAGDLEALPRVPSPGAVCST